MVQLEHGAELVVVLRDGSPLDLAKAKTREAYLQIVFELTFCSLVVGVSRDCATAERLHGAALRHFAAFGIEIHFVCPTSVD